MNILKKFDESCKQKRAQLIAENYDEIVGEIQTTFQNSFINELSPLNLKVTEIVKFDYMTNLHDDGDKNLWINFITADNVLHSFKIVLNTQKESFIELDAQTTPVDKSSISINEIKEFIYLCLSVFRRGYDKQGN